MSKCTLTLIRRKTFNILIIAVFLRLISLSVPLLGSTTKRYHLTRYPVFPVLGKAGVGTENKKYRTCPDFAGFAGSEARQNQANIKACRKEISQLIDSSAAEVGFSFHDLESGLLLEINERAVMHAASLMKVPVMIEVFRRIDKGELNLQQKVTVRNSFKSLADGSLFFLRPEDDSDPEFYSYVGREVPLKELISRMITVSSNLATNILIDMVKPASIMETIRALGASQMKVLRGVEDSKAYEKGLNNVTAARDMRLILEAIADGRAASAGSCAAMIEILQAQQFREGIPAGLPAEIKAGNKTGVITRIAHDAAVVFPPGRKPYVLVILTRGLEKEEDAQRLIASLSCLVYQRLIAPTTRRQA